MTAFFHCVFTPQFSTDESICINIGLSIMGTISDMKLCSIPELTEQQKKTFNDALLYLIKFFRDLFDKAVFKERTNANHQNSSIGSLQIIMRQPPESTEYKVTFGGGMMFYLTSEQSKDAFFQQIKNLLMTFYQL
jgi:hypothetical protein